MKDPTVPPKIRPPFLKQWTSAAGRPMFCQVTYTYQDIGLTHLAEGVLRDCSNTECGIRGRILPPVGSMGRRTTLTLYLRDQQRPVSFDGMITWTAGEFFGVHIPEMDEQDYKRVRRYMWDVHYVNMILW